MFQSVFTFVTISEGEVPLIMDGTVGVRFSRESVGFSAETYQMYIVYHKRAIRL